MDVAEYTHTTEHEQMPTDQAGMPHKKDAERVVLSQF